MASGISRKKGSLARGISTDYATPGIIGKESAD
jgi:hypothetical protein